MATLDWDGLVFYDQQIKKHIENKLVDAGISKDELDKILDKYASKTYVADEIAKATTSVDLTGYAKTSDVDTKLANYVKKNDAFSGSYNDLTDKPNIPNVSNLATKTEVTTHTDDTSIHVTSAEKSKWNAKAELSDIPSLTNYATKTFVTDEIAKASTGSTVDLTAYAKKVDVDSALNAKVDKVTGKSLVSDTEIARLATINNYDDTDVKRSINTKASISDVNAHTSDNSIHITSAERTKWNNKAEITDIPSLTNYATKTYVTDEIVKASTSGTVDLSGYAKTVDVNASLDTKVDKVSGKSLISDTEIARLKLVDNYDDTSIKSSITNINTQLNTKANKSELFSGSYNDLTDKPNIPNVTGKADKTYVDTELAKKANKSELFNGDYNNLTNKPTIPNVTGKADKTYVDTELAKKANKSELFSGSYNDLTDKPNIPNISNLATKTELNNHISSTKHITDNERTKWNGYNDTINTMKTNFEDGVNTIYNAVVAKGVTPSDKSPSNVAKAIESLVIKEKGQLLLKFKSSSFDKLPAPKFNDDNSYNYTCEDTDNGDGTYTRSIYGAKKINQICFYGDKNKDWFNSLEYTANVKIVSAEDMFFTCGNLESVNLNNIDTSECQSFNNMFNGCKSLTSLDVSNFNTLRVTEMMMMFNRCESLTSLDLSNFNTSQVFDMSYMFSGCRSLASLDIRNFSSASLTDYSYMFNNVPSTCVVYVDKTKFTKTEAECGFKGTFTDVSQQG